MVEKITIGAVYNLTPIILLPKHMERIILTNVDYINEKVYVDSFIDGTPEWMDIDYFECHYTLDKSSRLKELIDSL